MKPELSWLILRKLTANRELLCLKHLFYNAPENKFAVRVYLIWDRFCVHRQNERLIQRPFTSNSVKYKATVSWGNSSVPKTGNSFLDGAVSYMFGLLLCWDPSRMAQRFSPNKQMCRYHINSLTVQPIASI